MNACKMFLVFNLFFVSVCAADTFTNRKTGESFDGYATQQTGAGKTMVRTADAESPAKTINLADYDVEWNFKGRRNQVIVLPIKDEISLESETAAFEKAVQSASNQGPLFIVIAIDTPGGRIDFMKRICAALIKAKNCRTIAYICGGQYGGAYSAGAIISLACDRIYMADNTAIGAATPIVESANGVVKDMKGAFGEAVGEKYLSAFRAFAAATAEDKGRSGSLAKAMVDKDIQVAEVADADGRHEFIEPQNKKPNQSVVRTVKESGRLLTLTTAEAIDAKIADDSANSMEDLLAKLGASGARVIQKNEATKSRREYEKYKQDFDKLMAQIDSTEKEAERLTDNINDLGKQWDEINNNFKIGNREELMRRLSQQRKAETKDLVRNLQALISLYKDAINSNKRCPDLNYDIQSFEKAINTAETKLRQAQELLKH